MISTAVRPHVPLLLLFAGLWLAGCDSSGQAPVAEKSRVAVAAITAGPAQPAVLTSGVITTNEELKLSFKVGGIVRAVAVQEGAEVRAGQQLAALELTEIKAQSEQVRQLAAKARRDLERGEKMRADEVISEEQLEALRTQAAVAGAALRAAEFNQDYSTITARSDGVVLRKLVEEREFVQPGQPVLVVGPRAGGFIVKAGLSDRDIVRLQIGDPAAVTVDAFPDRQFPGRVTLLPAAADLASGLFAIEVELDPAPVKLVSGLVARLRIEPRIASMSSLAYAPIAAIIEADGDRAAVFVVENGIAKRRSVRIAFIESTAVAVTEGLEPGETVVTDGALYLEGGQAIQVVAPVPAAAR